MKKKVLILVIFVSLLISHLPLTSNEIDGTSGMLKQATVRKCKGKRYGKHKKHWHRAKKGKNNKKWYAKGKSLGKKKPKVCR